MQHKKEKIMIVAKTYPVPSSKYIELVCTAGVNEQGQWRRLYPIQFRLLQENKRYKKWEYIETVITKAENDRRPESYRPEQDRIEVIDNAKISPAVIKNRKAKFLNCTKIYQNMDELIQLAHSDEISIALFKPKKIEKFLCERDNRDWDSKRLQDLERQKMQLKLFDDRTTVSDDFRNVKKLPYRFKYRFIDEKENKSNMTILDWEIGQLFWNSLKSQRNNEEKACDEVRKKYFEKFVESKTYEILFVLGTIHRFHSQRASNPFSIIGVIYLTEEVQAIAQAMRQQGELPL